MLNDRFVKNCAGIIDLTYIKEYLQYEDYYFIILLKKVAKSFQESLSTMQTAYKEHNYQSVSNCAHKIAGGAVYCGALNLKNLCQELENILYDDDCKSVPKELYEKILIEIEKFEKLVNEDL